MAAEHLCAPVEPLALSVPQASKEEKPREQMELRRAERGAGLLRRVRRTGMQHRGTNQWKSSFVLFRMLRSVTAQTFQELNETSPSLRTFLSFHFFQLFIFLSRAKKAETLTLALQTLVSRLALLI